jgi:anti-sigma factor RsiW
MSHVDEGTLHAYLDGELPSSERTAVETHLAQCASCRATLDEARALLERASSLLGSARPPERAVPPFEELRRAPKRSPWRVRTSVAWAASIMLALGVGYYAHDVGSRTPSYETQPIALRVDSAAHDAAPAPAATRAERSAGPVQPRQQPAPQWSGARSDEVAQNKAAARADSLSGDVGALAIRPQVDLRKSSPTPAAAAPPTVAQVLRDSAPLNEVAVTSGLSARSASVPRNLVATQWPIISRGTAASLLGTKPVGLPGLATRRIRRSPGPDSTVVVEQALDATTVIQIFQRSAAGAGVDASASYYFDTNRARGYMERDKVAARELAPADRLARYVGRLRVEIAGPVSQDSLNRLLEQVEPLP